MDKKDLFCRIDLKYVGLCPTNLYDLLSVRDSLMPTECKGAALVGFTGDAGFNKTIRAKAIKRGLRLNEFGLWKRPNGWEPSEITNTRKDEEWEAISTPTEESVFEQLGETWVEPTKRNFNNLASRRK
jgi:DNA polymerase/3'-5' exonuclease PolX